MISIKKRTLGILAVALVMVSSCKNYLDVNNNPNQATDAPAELVLPAALANTGAYVTTYFPFLNLWMGYWNWSGNYSIALTDKNYQFTNRFSDETISGSGRVIHIWDDAYTTLKNYNAVDTKAAATGSYYTQGMAKIMKALHFQYLVDTYGNVPYTSALQGTANIQPTYDDAQAIYEDLFKQIDAALALFQQADATVAAGGTVISPGTNDIMFAGKIDQWRKFGNTLKLRMLLRQSERADRQAFIQAQLAILKASPYGFLGAGENAGINPGYTNSANLQNPFYGTYGYQVNGSNIEAYNVYKANKYGIDFYEQANDPRLGAYYTPVGGSGSTYDATNFGTIDPLVNSAVSGIGPGVLQSVSQASVILSSHESLFMQAEAAQRGWISGDPKTFYQSAITESFKNVGLTADAAVTYYSQEVDNVGWDTSTDKLTAIITQKWASENGLAPFEAWSDYRRLGLPRVPISEDPSTSIKQIPVRLFYPQSENNYNQINLTAQGQINQFTSKIFWMK